jgi:hypothetical protein
VIVEHSDDDHCEDRRDDKQHHYADHDRPPIFACLHAESKQRGTSWATRLLRGGHSRGAPTKLVNTVADERGVIGRQAAGERAQCLHGGDGRAVSVAPDDQPIAVVLDRAPSRGRRALCRRGSMQDGMSSWARRRNGIWPPPHRRDLQRRSLPRIDPASRRSPTWPLERIRPATAVCYLQRDVFIQRCGLDWKPSVVYQRRPHCAFPRFTYRLPALGSSLGCPGSSP